jgi:hypothetical protein
MDEQVDRFNRKLDAHIIDRLKREDRAALRLYRALERTREALFGRLLAFEDRWGSARAYTPGYLSQVLDEINQALAELRREAVGELRHEMEQGYSLGQEQTFEEVAVFYGGFKGIFAPRLPNDALFAIIDGRASLLEGTLERIRIQLLQQVRLAAAAAADDAEALSRAGASVEEIRDRLMVGIASGDGTRSIAKRLMAPREGEFVRLAYKDAVLITRLGINDAFNEGHSATLRQAKETLPGLVQVWVSAKVRSTPICLGLHGQVRDIGEDFSWRGWHGKRPPAIGQGAEPQFHLCRSRVAPHHPSWPTNPRLAPLDGDELAHFLSGGGFREKDIARRKVYPGFSPRADAVRES